MQVNNSLLGLDFGQDKKVSIEELGTAIKKRVALFDTDSNGVLSEKEIQAAKNQIFKLIDSDKDGLLSEKELSSSRLKKLAKSSRKTRNLVGSLQKLLVPAKKLEGQNIYNSEFVNNGHNLNSLRIQSSGSFSVSTYYETIIFQGKKDYSPDITGATEYLPSGEKRISINEKNNRIVISVNPDNSKEILLDENFGNKQKIEIKGDEILLYALNADKKWQLVEDETRKSNVLKGLSKNFSISLEEIQEINNGAGTKISQFKDWAPQENTELVNMWRNANKQYVESVDYPEFDSKFYAKTNAYINSMYTFLELMKTNCDESTIKKLKEEGLYNENIEFWVDQFNKESTTLSFSDFVTEKAKVLTDDINLIKEKGLNGYLKKIFGYEKQKNKFLHSCDVTNDIQDGIIGSLQQGKGTDCALLSRLYAYGLDGNNVSDLISKNSDGNSYNVSFKNLAKQPEILNFLKMSPFNFTEDELNAIIREGINITEEELKNNFLTKMNGETHSNPIKAVTGDKDVKILEFALNKFFTAPKKTEQGGWDDTLTNTPKGAPYNFTQMLIEAFLTGKDVKFYRNFSPKFTQPEIEKVLLTTKAEKLICASKDIPGSFLADGYKEIIGRHAYSIANIDKSKREITVVNPWDTNTRIKLTFDEFFKYFDNITVHQ